MSWKIFEDMKRQPSLKRLRKPNPVMVDCGYAQVRPQILAPPDIMPQRAIASQPTLNTLFSANEGIERIRCVHDANERMIREVGYAPPPPKPKPKPEPKLNEAEELRKKIEQYKDINEGLLRTNNQLQQSINEKTARINQLGKEKVGPFNIVIDTIDTSYVRDEKLTEIENLRNEFALVDRKGVELSKQMTELRRINLKLDLKLKGRNVRFDIKGIFF